jgi:hypothetical protein
MRRFSRSSLIHPSCRESSCIAEWVYENRPRFPKDIQSELNLIANTAYALVE